ncbi:FAR1-related sequence 10 [Tanacetum coccineum]
MDDLVQDFFIRPEGNTFDLDVYGETCFVDLVNRDQFTDVVLNSVINSLGYEMEDEVIVTMQGSIGYVKKHKVMDVYVEIVEKNEESESGSDSASESDNDFEDEEHVVQEVEVNMGYFNFQVEDASTGTDGNMIPVAPKVNLTEDNIEVLEFDSLESDLEDVPENDRRDLNLLQDCVQENYVCLGALKKGFREGGRELLGLDGAFMRGQYPGQMLTAVGVDANNGIYPVAYGIVESENQYSWTWFLKCLGDDFDLYSNSNFTFITDRQKGLLPALEKLFPHAEHRYCVRHIYENMNLTWKGSEYKEMLWKCASSTTTVMFEKNMQEFVMQDIIKEVVIEDNLHKVEQVMLLELKHNLQKVKQAGVGPLASQGGTSNAAGVGTQASQGGTSNTAGTKRKSKGSTGTSNAAGTQASQASKGGTSNAATQASTGSPLKRTKKSASRLTSEKWLRVEGGKIIDLSSSIEAQIDGSEPGNEGSSMPHLPPFGSVGRPRPEVPANIAKRFKKEYIQEESCPTTDEKEVPLGKYIPIGKHAAARPIIKSEAF